MKKERAMFSKTRRILQREDFLRIYKGKRRELKSFTLCWLRSEGGASGRLGVTVSKKVGIAVRRNRLKRRIRELFRQNKALFPQGADTVVIAKQGAAELSYGEILSEFEQFKESHGKSFEKT